MRSLKLSLVLFFLSLVLSISAQDLIWAKKIGGTGSIYPFKSITDNQSNVYIIGNYTGNINQGSFNYDSKNGTQDIFIAKFDKDGTLNWLNSYGGIGSDDILGIGLSPDENTLYITGYFQYDCYYSLTNFISVTGTPNATNEDVFLATLNPSSGAVINFNKIAWDTSTSTSQRIRGLKVTPDNKLVIFGTFNSEINFSNSSLTDASGKNQNFLAKINPDGTTIWLKHIVGTGTSAQATTVYSLDISSSGYYFGGYYRNDLQFDLGTISSTGGSNDLFLYKTDLNGNGIFLKRVSGAIGEFCTSVSVDKYDNVYIGGYTNTTSGGLNIDSIGTVASPIYSTIHPNSAGNYDLFFAKYNSSGTLQWYNIGGSTNADNIFRAISKNGLFIVAGRYGGAFTFRETAIPFSGGTSDALGLVYDNGDNLIYAINFGGTGTETGRTSTIDSEGNYIIIGDYTSNPLTIGSTSLGLSGSSDIFIAKYRKGSLDKYSTNITCKGSANGSISVSPRGPLTPPFTYTWAKDGSPITPTPPDPENLTGLSAGTYNLAFTDSEGFAINETFTITEPASALTLTAPTVNNVNCYGDATGSVTLSASGGTSPYTYNKNGGAYQGSTTFSNLRAGNYTFSVKDANGCTTTLVVSVSEPSSALTLSLTGTPDNGTNNGTATANPAGGTSPYGCSWNSTPVQNTLTATSLPVGTYTATVTDNKGCQVSCSIGISSFVVAITNKTDITCNGRTDGSATVTVTDGGTPPFTYSWNTVPVQTGLTATGLSAGTYQVIVTDNDSKTASTSVTIIEPALISATLNKTDITCIGYSDGSIETNVTGGTVPYSYSWTKDGGYLTNTADIFDLGKGSTYEVTITDKNSCPNVVKSETLSTTQSNLIVSITPTNAKCYLQQGSISGSVSSSVSGAYGTYTYLWNNGKTTSGITTNPGNFSLRVTDALGCQATATTTVSYGPEISGDISIESKPCIGTSTGSLKITPVKLGNGGLTYLWNNGQTTQTATNLAEGNYTVTISDNKNCQFQTSKTLDPNPLPTATINPSGAQSICQGSSITLNANTGLNYTYQWYKDGGLITGETNSSLTVSEEGVYDVVVTSTITSCSNTSNSATITVKPIPTASISTTDNTTWCENDAVSVNFTATVVPSATYQWYRNDDAIVGAASSTYTTTQAGIYNAQVTLNGCEAVSNDIEVVVNLLPLSAISTSDPIAYCEGAPISTNLSATPADGDTYKWYLDGTLIPDAITNSYTATLKGAYTVEITKTGCSATSSPTTISVNPLPTVTLAPFNGVCKNATPVALTGGEPTGGIYSLGGTPITDFDPSSTGSGDFTITYTYIDGNSCENTANSTITVYADLVAGSISGDQAICAGGDPVIFTSVSDPTGGNGTWTYSWESLIGTGSWTPITNTNSLTYDVPSGLLETTQYRRAETNSCGTVYSNTITVTVNPLPNVTLSTFAGVCEGSSAFTLTGGSPNGGSYSINGVSGATFDPIATGVGTHTIIYTYTDGLGCTNSASSSITVNALPIVAIDLGATVVMIKTNEQHTFDAGAGFATYLWNDGSTNQTLTVNGTNLTPGDYTYWVDVTNTSGCKNHDEITLNVSPANDINTTDDWQISLFPNPTKGEFKLNLSGLKTEKVEIAIHNSAGVVIYRKEYKTISGELHEIINIEQYSKGVYLVKISNHKLILTRKIVLE